MTTSGLLDRHLSFIEALRGAGMSVSLAEDLDSVAALGAVGWGDRAHVRDVLGGFADALAFLYDSATRAHNHQVNIRRHVDDVFTRCAMLDKRINLQPRQRGLTGPVADGHSGVNGKRGTAAFVSRH